MGKTKGILEKPPTYLRAYLHLFGVCWQNPRWLTARRITIFQAAQADWANRKVLFSGDLSSCHADFSCCFFNLHNKVAKTLDRKNCSIFRKLGSPPFSVQFPFLNSPTWALALSEKFLCWCTFFLSVSESVHAICGMASNGNSVEWNHACKLKWKLPAKLRSSVHDQIKILQPISLAFNIDAHLGQLILNHWTLSGWQELFLSLCQSVSHPTAEQASHL